MDVLSDILDLLKFKGSLYFATNFTAPFGIQVPPYKRVARFHLAVSGDCWVKVDGTEEPVRLQAGDMIIVPHGAPHALSDRIDTPIVSLDEALNKSGFKGKGHFAFGGDDESQTNLLCGHFEFDPTFSHPLLTELPNHILIRGEQAVEFSWFESAMRYMSYESRTPNLGGGAIVRRMSEILFIHAVRVWSATSNMDEGFLRAVSDRHIGRALQAFHANPADQWTIDRLAAEAGLSRSVFADRFRALMSSTPLSYVTSWRIQKACHFLLESDLPTDVIAEKVGYQSQASFSKVFKKIIGQGPGAYRRLGRTQEHAPA